MAAPGTAEGLRAQVLADIDNLSQKFIALAQVMAVKCGRRPGEGVRSVAAAFSLIVMENRMRANMLTGATTPRGNRT